MATTSWTPWRRPANTSSTRSGPRSAPAHRHVRRWPSGQTRRLHPRETKTINLTSVRGGKVVLGAHLDAMYRADNATTEFYSGGQQLLTTGVSRAREQLAGLHPGPGRPTAHRRYRQRLGVASPWRRVGSETQDTRTNNTATGTCFARSAHSGTRRHRHHHRGDDPAVKTAATAASVAPRSTSSRVSHRRTSKRTPATSRVPGSSKTMSSAARMAPR